MKRQANFRLEDEVKERIEQLAVEWGCPQAEVIGRCVLAFPPTQPNGTDGGGDSRKNSAKVDSSPSPGATAAVSPEVERVRAEAEALADEPSEIVRRLRERGK